MKLRYKGLPEGGSSSGGGCGACGKKATGKWHTSPTRGFTLLSGEYVVLKVGGITEFKDRDAMELLKYNSPTREVFEVVEV